MKIPENKEKECLDAIYTYLPLGDRVLEAMLSEQGRLVNAFRELFMGHNTVLKDLAGALKRNIESREMLRMMQEEHNYINSPEYQTSAAVALQAELDAITDPKEKEIFIARKRASLEGRLVELRADEEKQEPIRRQAQEIQLKARRNLELSEADLYKRALELGETEEDALKLATADHLPGIFQIYDLLTIVYEISTEKDVAQRRAKIRYLLEIDPGGEHK